MRWEAPTRRGWLRPSRAALTWESKTETTALDIVPRRRVLMLIPSLGSGGAEGSFLRLAGALSQRHDVRALTFSEDSLAHISERPSFGLGALGRGVSGPSAWLERWYQLRQQKRRCDVCISFLAGANLLNSAAQSSAKTILSIRGSRCNDIESTTTAKGRLLYQLERMAWQRADMIHAASEGLAYETRKLAPQLAPRIISIEGTLKLETLLEQLQKPIEEPIRYRPHRLVSFGRLHPQKGFDRLFEVIAAIKHSGRPIQLLVLGEGGERSHLETRARQLGLELSRDSSDESAHIVMPGFREAPYRYIGMGAAFVFSSLYEGLPNALLEATLTGAPILAADAPWGVRTVLSERTMTAGFDKPVQSPVELKYGTLLPPIETPTVPLWAHRAHQILSAAPDHAPNRAQPIEYLQSFSVAAASRRWMELIDTVCERSGPRPLRTPADPAPTKPSLHSSSLR